MDAAGGDCGGGGTINVYDMYVYEVDSCLVSMCFPTLSQKRGKDYILISFDYYQFPHYSDYTMPILLVIKLAV